MLFGVDERDELDPRGEKGNDRMRAESAFTSDPQSRPAARDREAGLGAGASTMSPARGISPLKVPSASVSIPSGRPTRRPSQRERTGATTRSFPCTVAIAARRPSKG
jgi:hypothetical protein